MYFNVFLSLFQIYDSKLEHNPLFIYKLPLGSLKVTLSDRVIFTASKLGGEQKLLILSNQKTETSEDQEKVKVLIILFHFCCQGEPRTPEREVGGSIPILPLCCVFEQRHICSPKSTGNTQEVVAPSRHD